MRGRGSPGQMAGESSYSARADGVQSVGFGWRVRHFILQSII